MDYSATKTCYIEEEEDDGLASLAETEASGYSFLRSICCSRRNSLRNLSLFPSSVLVSPRSMRFYDARFEDNQPRFLEACYLCKKPLGGNRDIFMYRGDTPFCSEECRQEQIEMDEAKEKKRKLSSSMKMGAVRKNDHNNNESADHKYPFHTGTIVAA